MPTESILDKCKKTFKSEGWTYDGFAAKSGVSRTTISTYFNNPPKKPRPATVKAIADALGIDASAIPETNEEPENASEIFMVTHCAACRKVTETHNKELREDFNTRFAAMEKSYKEHEKAIADQYEKRIKAQLIVIAALALVLAVAAVVAAIHIAIDWSILT